MSKVVDQSTQQQQPQQPAQSAQPHQPENWILDDVGSRQGTWVLDDEPQQPTPAPAPAPVPGQQPQPQPQQPQPQRPAQPTAPAPAPGTLPGQGYTYTLPTGHTFRGTSPEDVIGQMSQMLITTAQTAVQQRQQLDQARTYMGRQTAYSRGGSGDQPQPQPSGRQQFNPDAFYADLASAKPVEAIHRLLQEYFQVDDPREALTTSYSTSQKMNDRLEVADFIVENQDFPFSPQSSDLLLRRIHDDNVPLTKWNLEVAANQLYREGALQRVPIAQPDQPQSQQGAGYQQQYQQPQQPTQSRGFGAPPLPPSGSGADNENDRNLTDYEFEQLSTQDQRNYLVRKGLI